MADAGDIATAFGIPDDDDDDHPIAGGLTGDALNPFEIRISALEEQKLKRRESKPLYGFLCKRKWMEAQERLGSHPQELWYDDVPGDDSALHHVLCMMTQDAKDDSEGSGSSSNKEWCPPSSLIQAMVTAGEATWKHDREREEAESEKKNDDETASGSEGKASAEKYDPLRSKSKHHGNNSFMQLLLRSPFTSSSFNDLLTAVIDVDPSCLDFVKNPYHRVMFRWTDNQSATDMLAFTIHQELTPHLAHQLQLTSSLSELQHGSLLYHMWKRVELVYGACADWEQIMRESMGTETQRNFGSSSNEGARKKSANRLCSSAPVSLLHQILQSTSGIPLPFFDLVLRSCSDDDGNTCGGYDAITPLGAALRSFSEWQHGSGYRPWLQSSDAAMQRSMGDDVEKRDMVQFLEAILRRFPGSSGVPAMARNGLYPLHLALHKGREMLDRPITEKKSIVEVLWADAPQVLSLRDAKTNLFPFLIPVLEPASDITSSYLLLREDPSLVAPLLQLGERSKEVTKVEA